MDHQVQWVRKEILAEMVTLDYLANLVRKVILVHLVEKELLAWMDQEDFQG